MAGVTDVTTVKTWCVFCVGFQLHNKISTQAPSPIRMLLPLISRWITAGSLVWRYSSPSWQCEQQDWEKCMTYFSFHPLKSSRALKTKPKFSLSGSKNRAIEFSWKCLSIPRLYVLMQFRLVLAEYLLLFDPDHIPTARNDVQCCWVAKVWRAYDAMRPSAKGPKSFSASPIEGCALEMNSTKISTHSPTVEVLTSQY